VVSHIASLHAADRLIAVDTAYSPEMISSLQAKEGSEKISYYNITPPQVNADCVLILDVLEHCSNDAQVLRESIHQGMTTPESVILISVPAFQGLFSQHDQLLGHHRRYSRRALTTLVKKEDLVVIESGYFFFSLLPLRILQLLFEKIKIRKASKSIDDWNGGATVSKIISSILWADFRICHFLSRAGIHLPGLSCYCLCKKSPS
jgi:hypothetical protein